MELVSDNKECLTAEDFRHLVATIIASHTHGIFVAEDICHVDNAVYEAFIRICVDGDDVLCKNYESLNITDINEKFVRSVVLTARDYSSQIAKTIKNVIPTSFQKQIVESSKMLTKNIETITAPLLKMSETMGSIISSAQLAWTESLRDTIKPIIDSIPDYSNMFNRITSTIQAMLKEIQIPTIPEETKEELIASYVEWGKLGWTIPPDADLTVFRIAPMGAKEAINSIRAYVNDKHMEMLFGELLHMKHIRKSDMNEAINCFKGRHYKACALTLFSMIDARLIRSQLDEDRNPKNKQRPSGKKAATNLFERIEAKYINENMFFTMLYQINILAALKVLFENGDDFRIQPKVINRNFLDHGMLHKNVRKIDCVMLFLLLYNFTRHLNAISENIAK